MPVYVLPIISKNNWEIVDIVQSLSIMPLIAINPPSTAIKPNVEDICMNNAFLSGYFFTKNPAANIGIPTNEGIREVTLVIPVKI